MHAIAVVDVGVVTRPLIDDEHSRGWRVRRLDPGGNLRVQTFDVVGTRAAVMVDTAVGAKRIERNELSSQDRDVAVLSCETR